jgi:hypothetical protein
MRWVGATLLLGAWLLVVVSAADAQPAKDAFAPNSAQSAAPNTPSNTAEEAKVEGFRSASFGMLEAQVRQAIRKDFPGPGEKITSEANAAEKTTVLGVIVPDVIPGTGKARVSYILGYTTKKLIQINLNWSAEPKSPTTAEGLVGAANLLRSYFLAGGYRPDSIVANQQLPNGYVVFRGLDARGRMVMLVLQGATGALDHDKAPPVALQLSYILDPEHPDVYQVPKGSF